MSPVVFCSVTVSAFLEIVTPAVSLSVIVPVKVIEAGAASLFGNLFQTMTIVSSVSSKLSSTMVMLKVFRQIARRYGEILAPPLQESDIVICHRRRATHTGITVE